MRFYFLILTLCLALAALAAGRAPLLLAAGPDGGQGGPPPWGGMENGTRPQGPGQHPGGNREQAGPGNHPAWAGQDNATRPGGPPQGGGRQGGLGGPPPGMGQGPGGQAGQGGQGGQGGPPNREALAQACSGKAANDECSFASPQGGQVTGQCVQARQGNELVCHPKRQ